MTGDNFKVDFFCVGVAKAGTTTLHDLLSLQNNISLPRKKETNYFSFGISGRPSKSFIYSSNGCFVGRIYKRF